MKESKIKKEEIKNRNNF